MSAFRAQQFRWAKGTVQTARKLLGRVLARTLTLRQRVEAFFHLTPHFAYPLMVLLSVLLLPALVLMPATNGQTMLLIDLPLCIGTTGSLAAFYAMAEAAQGAVGVGARFGGCRRSSRSAPGCARTSRRPLRTACGSMAGEFVRTPKHGARGGRYSQYARLPMLGDRALPRLRSRASSRRSRRGTGSRRRSRCCSRSATASSLRSSRPSSSASALARGPRRSRLRRFAEPRPTDLIWRESRPRTPPAPARCRAPSRSIPRVSSLQVRPDARGQPTAEAAARWQKPR